jgi:hypothetical protein
MKRQYEGPFPGIHPLDDLVIDENLILPKNVIGTALSTNTSLQTLALNTVDKKLYTVSDVQTDSDVTAALAYYVDLYTNQIIRGEKSVNNTLNFAYGTSPQIKTSSISSTSGGTYFTIYSTPLVFATNPHGVNISQLSLSDTGIQHEAAPSRLLCLKNSDLLTLSYTDYPATHTHDQLLNTTNDVTFNTVKISTPTVEASPTRLACYKNSDSQTLGYVNYVAPTIYDQSLNKADNVQFNKVSVKDIELGTGYFRSTNGAPTITLGAVSVVGTGASVQLSGTLFAGYILVNTGTGGLSSGAAATITKPVTQAVFPSFDGSVQLTAGNSLTIEKSDDIKFYPELQPVSWQLVIGNKLENSKQYKWFYTLSF